MYVCAHVCTRCDTMPQCCRTGRIFSQAFPTPAARCPRAFRCPCVWNAFAVGSAPTQTFCNITTSPNHKNERAELATDSGIQNVKPRINGMCTDAYRHHSVSSNLALDIPRTRRILTTSTSRSRDWQHWNTRRSIVVLHDKQG